MEKICLGYVFFGKLRWLFVNGRDMFCVWMSLWVNEEGSFLFYRRGVGLILWFVLCGIFILLWCIVVCGWLWDVVCGVDWYVVVIDG